MSELKRILTKPDATPQSIIEAIGDMRTDQVLQVQVESWSRPVHIMTKIEEAYPYSKFMHECFKKDGSIWMYITTVTND